MVLSISAQSPEYISVMYFSVYHKQVQFSVSLSGLSEGT